MLFLFLIGQSYDKGSLTMKMVKIRETLAAFFALVLVIVLLAVVAKVFGFEIPGLIHITNALGIGG